MKDPVLMKSNRYCITLYFNPDISFDQLLSAVKETFDASAHFFDHAQMLVEYEGRTFTKEEELTITEMIEQAAGIHILCILERDNATEEVHKRILNESISTFHGKDGMFYKGTLRERQILESETSIVIIGDVEGGATVVSRGNVVVTGTIYGSVTAGAGGNYHAVIAAHRMEPCRLRIGDIELKPVIGGCYSWAKLL